MNDINENTFFVENFVSIQSKVDASDCNGN